MCVRLLKRGTKEFEAPNMWKMFKPLPVPTSLARDWLMAIGVVAAISAGGVGWVSFRHSSVGTIADQGTAAPSNSNRAAPDSRGAARKEEKNLSSSTQEFDPSGPPPTKTSDHVEVAGATEDALKHALAICEAALIDQKPNKLLPGVDCTGYGESFR